ncbi:MAG: tRNA (guanosine(46)-N7)-methyltransferase TrmB [Myxococcota bacterium]|nr:tRNA (guanosine(46)-N7)-methyltransferase TrmB [Myxococcota bacterium]
MSRALKYDIPGEDWRRTSLDLADLGVKGLFERGAEAPKRFVLEVGFGRGEFLLELACREPGTAFVGVEVSYKRVLKMARKVAVAGLENVRLLEGRGEVILGELIADASLDEIWVNFSDPWPKERHASRRVIQSGFVAHVARCLLPGGILHVATDDPTYAQQIHAVLSAEPALANEFPEQSWRSAVPGRIRTGYEEDWLREGRSLFFFDYRCKGQVVEGGGS